MKRTLGVTAVVLTALLLAGCTGSTGEQSSTGQSPGSPGGITGKVPDESGPVTVDGTTDDVKTANRDVITTGSVSITVKDPIESAQDAVALTEQAGGRIDSRSENPETDKQAASATLTLRIPSDELSRTLTELKKLGSVNFVTLNSSDVTQQSRDLDARITALQTSVDRLLGLISKASNTADLIAIESALSSRQSDLESYQSQRDYLSDQIDYATISLELFAEGTIAAGPPDNFWTGIVLGWNALMGALGGALVGLGVAIPWIGMLLLLAGIVLLVVRLSTRKRKPA